MSTAVEQVERLLNLVPYLRSHPGVTVAEVAREFGVSQRQIAKDLNVLWFCGTPGGFSDDLMEPHVGEGGAIHLDNAAEAITRPLRLSTREAVALLVALRAMAAVPGLADRVALERVLAKLEAAVGQSAADTAERLSVAFEARDVVLEAATRAQTSGRALRLRYYVPSRDEVTERTVDPIRISMLTGRAYLDAWCRTSADRRMFRLDRVVGIEVLEEPAVVPEHAANAPEAEHSALRVDAQDPLIELELAPGARWVPEYYPCESVTDLPGGGVRVALRAPDQDRIRRLVLRLGESARVLGPAGFAAAVQGTAAAALAGYGF
ncbi:helix-turn-helix transcriptional regulator [Actinospica robiniae]|uniref:helix-turn-helix transcriptional regulator n=1 Tax=Actinospica robiniae TaxID=304901 RepID=UPI00040A4333|nr:WYL domain-containing protein [Actinospica robiniae]